MCGDAFFLLAQLMSSCMEHFIDTLATNFMEETNCMGSEQEEEKEEEEDRDKGDKEVKNGKINHCGLYTFDSHHILISV